MRSLYRRIAIAQMAASSVSDEERNALMLCAIWMMSKDKCCWM
jgi:hypothetical protein